MSSNYQNAIPTPAAWRVPGRGNVSVMPHLEPALAEARHHIPFNRIAVVGNEMEYMADAVRNGHCSGDGPFTRKCQDLLRRELNSGPVLLTTSCTHALEMAAMLLDLEPGDEVIVPTYTFVSSINAFVLRGAKPVFIDVRPDTLNLDETLLEGLITPRTRAIVVVHYAGVACEMDTILEIANRHGIAVIEDNAHGLFGTYKGRPLGTMGAFATLSFHETKNYACGEGGALIVNDAKYTERAEVLREKGTNRSRFFRGEVDKYTWVDIGSSYVLSDMNAGYLYGQLEKFREIRQNRERIWANYWHHLGEWATRNGVGMPQIPSHCGQAYHLFYLLLPSLAERQEFIAHMKAAAIKSVFHYVPLHSSPMGRQWSGDQVCPVAGERSDRLVRLPFFNCLTEADQARVILATQQFKVSSRQRPAQSTAVA
jgi:dTDP-4-amino-4,6-dideoxygalactose transaminase